MQRENSKYRRTLDRLPQEMKELMSLLNHECNILVHHAGSRGWSVDFTIKDTSLTLTYDRGSLVVVKDPKGEGKNLFPEGKDWLAVTVSDLANEINEEFA